MPALNLARGIDVNRWRESVDWNKVKAAGVKYGITKTTQGTNHVDRYWEENWRGVRRVGLVFGAYHFMEPLHDPIAQAKHYLRTVEGKLRAGDFPHILDVEVSPRNTIGAAWRRLRRTDRLQRIRAWLEFVESESDRKPMLYTSQGAWREITGDSPSFTEYPLWIANYGVPTPRLPANNWGGKGWVLWQYTDSGRMNGVNGGAPPVDLDYFNGAYDDLLDWLDAPGDIEPEDEPEALTNQDMINAFYRAAGLLGEDGWTWIESAGLTAMAFPSSNRLHTYSGPAIETLPNLNPDQINALREVLGLPVIDIGPSDAEPERPDVTNQILINAFFTAASQIGQDGWEWITRAELTHMTNPPSNRALPYDGPAIERLAGLTEPEKAAVLAALAGAQPTGAEASDPAPEPIPAVTNQVLINAFYKAAARTGQDGWAWIERAGLIGIATPSSNRSLPYSGPPLSRIPNLTTTEIAALRETVEALQRAEPEVLRWEQHALPGLHGPGDPGGGWVSEAFEVVRLSRVRAVKVMAPDLQTSEAAQLRQIDPNMFILARLFSANQLHERRGDGTPEGTGRWFANEVADPGDSNNPMNRAYHGAGLRYFEVHNEPNLITEGAVSNWRDGAEFARFFRAVVEQLQPRYPQAKFGFPGLSPGPAFPARPINMWTFLKQAQAAVQQADFLCCHFYWGGDGSSYHKAIEELRRFCEQYPRKLVFCTEFSNNHRDVPREQKADQYAQFYAACKRLPSNLGGVFVYALSWRDDHNNEGFLTLDRDSGRWLLTPMAARLGSRSG